MYERDLKAMLAEHHNPKEANNIHRFILAQARVAFSKSSKNCSLELEDFVSRGYETYLKAFRTWKPDMATKFNTYLTTCLQRDFYKSMRNTHTLKRGGNNGDPENHQATTWTSIEELSERNPENMMPGLIDNEAEYNLLLEQVEKNLDKNCRTVFKQLIDPDEKLKRKAIEKYKGRNTFSITPQMIADHLGISISEFKVRRETIKTTLQKLGITPKSL
jgi:RNA polymerase sigma factor (sigma-70 family)